MCEWLLLGEWCDVKLLCAGRIFNAHRAVLAAVSPFLRKLLLSCTDESETLIVLPDIDLDAMSSVLYYIYNGEVSMEIHKQEKFLEVVKTLQIFIERQYLPDHDKNFDYLHKCDSKFRDNDVFILGKDIENKVYVHLTKGQPLTAETLLCLDKCLKYPKQKRNEKDDYFKMQLPGGRQNSCNVLNFEKYPQNGYSNGLTEGVLAISSRFYHEPSSKPLMNSNDVLRDETLSEISRKKEQAHTNMERSQNGHKAYVTKLSKNFTTDYHNGTGNLQESTNLWASHVSILPLPLLPEVKDNVLQKHNITPSLDLSVQSISMDQTTYCNRLLFDRELIQNSLDTKKSKSHLIKNIKKSNKVICNQVLRNPWCPQQPNNYRAFKRKAQNDVNFYIRKKTTANYSNSDDINDSNNNLNISATPANESTKDVISSHEPDEINASTCPKNQPSTIDPIYKKESSGRYTCDECSKTFSQLRNFKYHMSIHRGTKEFAATCAICGKYFNDRGYLSSHMKIHRNRKEYKCSQCPKSFNQRVAYNMHVRIHTGIKPHVCDECGKAFSRKMLLKQHYRTHSGERPYACPHCDKRFADRSNMTLHLRLHTGVKPFSCTMCPKSFTKKHHLKSHLNFHTGAKPYSCPRCNLAFTQSSNMRTHFKKCTAPEASSNVDS